MGWALEEDVDDEGWGDRMLVAKHHGTINVLVLDTRNSRLLYVFVLDLCIYSL